MCLHRVREAVDKALKNEIEEAKYEPIKERYDKLLKEKEENFLKDFKNVAANRKRWSEEEKEIAEIEVLHMIS